MLSEPTSKQWIRVFAGIFLLGRGSTLAIRAMPNRTSCGLTQVGITADCNAFTYVNIGDTCNDTAQEYGITLAQFSAWNPVLGYPDGNFCKTQFWAEYDYCVGVSGTSTSNPIVSSPSPPGPAAMISGKIYTTLPDDGPPSDYVVKGINCLEIVPEFYPECWERLNINSWLPKWYAEEPRCSSRQTERGCRIDSPDRAEKWTITFMREYIGAGGTHCAALPGNCSYFPGPNDGVGMPPLARARYRYVCYNIVAIHDFFASWESAINNALGRAGELIPAIVDMIDTREPKKTHVDPGLASAALSVGLGFIPEIGPAAGVSAAGIAAANVGLTALNQAQQVAAAMWPTPLIETHAQQAEANSDAVKNVMLTQSLHENLEDGLAEVHGQYQIDVSAFLAFAGLGSFSTNQQNHAAPNVLTITGEHLEPLLLAYTTYLVSTTLAQTGWHAILLPGVDPQGITNQAAPYPSWAGDHPDAADLKCTEYNETGQCSGTY
ncbi:MAG: hypothetical protein Q9225_006148 [Loekoesia sp. 1 TL-2023]